MGGQKRWYTLVEACEIIGVTRSTFDKWRVKGVAPRALKLPNGSLRIEVEDLEAWLASLPEAA
jgi:predicted DNA-binding transcriptional regulator AlpA